jgi:hypothetical protein
MAGLRTYKLIPLPGLSTSLRFPARFEPVRLNEAFVLVYRCGTAPELHRIPCFHADSIGVPTASVRLTRSLIVQSAGRQARFASPGLDFRPVPHSPCGLTPRCLRRKSPTKSSPHSNKAFVLRQPPVPAQHETITSRGVAISRRPVGGVSVPRSESPPNCRRWRDEVR